MKIINVQIRNFRLLNDCNFRLDEFTTVLVGKNNAGKTSLSSIIQLFLDNQRFSFDDFSIACHVEFIKAYKEYISVNGDDEKLEDFFKDIGKRVPSIQMQLNIEYGINDNWSNIRSLLTSLDSSNELQILFSYEIKEPKAFFEKLFSEMQKGKIKKKEENAKIIKYISKIFDNFFGVSIKPVNEDVHTEEVKFSEMRKIIASQFIAAQRNVEDGNSTTSSKLAPVFQREYKKSEQRQNKDSEEDLQQLNNELETANTNIDAKLATFFKDFTESFSTFGYPNIEGVDIILKSNVTPTNLFKGIQSLALH